MWTAVRCWARRNPLIVDLALVGVIYMCTLIAFGARFSALPSAHPTALDALLAAAATVPLLARRRAPFWALGIATAVCVIVQASGGDVAPLVTPLSAALYNMAVRTERRTAWAAAAVTAACTIGPAVLWAPGLLFGPQRLGALTWIGLATAVGDSVRGQRAYVKALTERATRAERNREEEAARRVTEERMRIARELHDVVAHELTLITTQSSISVHLGQRDPAVLVDNLVAIRDHSKQALDELRAIVGLLTQPGDGATPRDPVPGLHQLEELVASFARAGLRVEVVKEGEKQPLPSAVDLAAYRIVQEALTNVRKHGGVDVACVRVGFGRDAVRLTVENGGSVNAAAPDNSASGGTGRGLISIRERTAAVGGQVVVGRRPQGGFSVDARLPFARPVRLTEQSSGAGR
ncbi:sensor histidine kinase [Streptomyces sp. NPDC058086]|uniref:sensor histidine kinase n=1 Tax=Streptomyces sp. NPDC058086 TaxID=3346334 RepID=UPI0036F1946E